MRKERINSDEIDESYILSTVVNNSGIQNYNQQSSPEKTNELPMKEKKETEGKNT